MSFLKTMEDYLLKKAIKHIGGQKNMAIQLDITNACNLKCSHCYHSNHKNTGALNLEGWLEILDQYDKMLQTLKLQPYIVICGGEPTLSPLNSWLKIYTRIILLQKF